MKIKSNFNNKEKIPSKYTSDGENINPPLEISEIPETAKSLVLIVEDPDAQRVAGYTWIHWIVFNIPIEKTEFKIKENSIPGKSGKSTYEKSSYGGPSPPAGSGIHNYYFKIYALDNFLNLENPDKTEIKQAMQGHVLDKTELIGIYSRDNL